MHPVVADASAWIAAVGGLVAAVGTIGTLIASFVIIGRERSNREADDLRRARQQAQLVDVTFGGWGSDSTGVDSFVVVRNDSPSSPFFDVLARCWNVADPSNLREQRVPVLRPDERKQFGFRFPPRVSNEEPVFDAIAQFRDGDGREFERNTSGVTTLRS